ncbi:MAG TPA: hypothetical protein PKY56_05365, partial [Candidatus Kapabacteria bacterium]|nr:hypothetical protein [Candidatus Kapabacteria bacterium]
CSKGFFAYEQAVLISYLITKDQENLISLSIPLESIPYTVDKALEEIKAMRNGASKLPQKYAVLKEAKKILLEVIDLLINEFAECKKMAINIIDKIELVKTTK